MALKKLFDHEKKDGSEKKDKHDKHEHDKHHKHEKKSHKGHVKKRDAVINSAPEDESPESPFERHNVERIRKLESINSELSLINLPANQKKAALEKIAQLRELFKTSTDNNAITVQLEELDKIVLDLRYAAVEAAKEDLHDKTIAVLNRGERTEDLLEKVSELETGAAQFKLNKQPAKKKGSFFSLFSCLPCCSGNDTDEDEKRPLLRKQ